MHRPRKFFPLPFSTNVFFECDWLERLRIRETSYEQPSIYYLNPSSFQLHAHSSFPSTHHSSLLLDLLLLWTRGHYSAHGPSFL